VNLFINVFTREYVVLIKRFIRPKDGAIDSQRLLLAVNQQESYRRFIGGYLWDYVRFTGAAICEN